MHALQVMDRYKWVHKRWYKGSVSLQYRAVLLTLPNVPRSHVVTVDEAVDLLQAGDEVKDLIVIWILFAVQQVHVVVNSLFVIAWNHVQQPATRNIASERRKQIMWKMIKKM